MKRFFCAAAVLITSALDPTLAHADIWSQLDSRVRALIEKQQDRFEIHIEDVRSKRLLTYGEKQPVYMASTIKIFVLIEVMRQISLGKIQPEQKLMFGEADSGDGSPVNEWTRPGTPITVQTHMHRMMIYSDNSSTDILINLAGIEKINSTAKKYFPNGNFKITSMLQVRRLAYSQFHPGAASLAADAFSRIKKQPHSKRLDQLAKELQVERSALTRLDLYQGWEAYYNEGQNTSNIETLAKVMKKLARGEIVSPEVSYRILEIMSLCQTGKMRLVAGLKAGYTLSHKTGTQIRRACDAGVIRKNGQPRLVVAVCARQYPSLRKIEETMAEITKSIFDSGVLP